MSCAVYDRRLVGKDRRDMLLKHDGHVAKHRDGIQETKSRENVVLRQQTKTRTRHSDSGVFGFLERYYVRMYSTHLSQELFHRFSEMRKVWNSYDLSLWRAIPCQLPTHGAFIDLSEPRMIRPRYSSAPRSRSRSR